MIAEIEIVEWMRGHGLYPRILDQIVPAIAEMQRAVESEWGSADDSAGELLQELAYLHRDLPGYRLEWTPFGTPEWPYARAVERDNELTYAEREAYCGRLT